MRLNLVAPYAARLRGDRIVFGSALASEQGGAGTLSDRSTIQPLLAEKGIKDDEIFKKNTNSVKMRNALSIFEDQTMYRPCARRHSQCRTHYQSCGHYKIGK